MFVDVPISVHVPPNIAAKESGIKTFDPLIFISLATLSITGMKIATMGVLFTKADRIPINAIVAIMPTQNPYLWKKLIILTLAASTKPVLINAPLTTNNAAIVTVASLLKPETPSSTVIIPVTIRKAININATRSTGTFSVANKMIAIRTSDITTMISRVI